MKRTRQIISILLFFLLGFNLFGQTDNNQKNNLYKKGIENITEKDLLEMPLEDLMKIVQDLKLSSIKELYDLIVNPTVISASKKEEKSFDSPLTIHVITDTEIENAGATNIPEALRLIPGLIVREKTNGNFDVHIRGNNNIPPGKNLFFSENTITLLMIDNQPMNNNFRGGIHWETLPINIQDIKKIEVISGPSSALYGPNAVSGVIHIITKQTSDKLSASASANLGTQNSYNANFNVNIPINNKIRTRISSGYNQRDRFQDNYFFFCDYNYHKLDDIKGFYSDFPKEHPEPELAYRDFNTNILFEYKPNNKTTLSFWAAHQISRIQNIFIDITDFPITTRESQTSYFNLKGQIGNLNTQLSYNRGTIDNLLGVSGYKFNISNLQFQSEYTFAINNNFSFTPGAYFSYSSMDDRDYISPPNIGLFNKKAIGTNLRLSNRINYITPNKRLRLNAALSIEKYDTPQNLYFAHILSASYKLSKNNMMRLVYSKANRGPFFYDYKINFENNYEGTDNYTHHTIFESNKKLKLETMEMVELGIRNKISKAIQTDLSIFYSKVKNLSDFFYYDDTLKTTITSIQQKQNIKTLSHQVGVSFLCNAVPTASLQLSGFITVQMTILEQFLDYFNLIYNQNTFSIPYEHDLKHESTPSIFGGLTANYKATDKFNLNTNIYFVGKQNFLSIDGYSKIPGKINVNCRMSYQITPNINTYITGKNVLNNRDPEFLFADHTGASLLIGTKISF
ncbi:MAG: TonB-dependent receptor plug domain-containing protein [Bacteroidales bacterium]